MEWNRIARSVVGWNRMVWSGMGLNGIEWSQTQILSSSIPGSTLIFRLLSSYRLSLRTWLSKSFQTWSNRCSRGLCVLECPLWTWMPKVVPDPGTCYNLCRLGLDKLKHCNGNILRFVKVRLTSMAIFVIFRFS